jgi:hypothetical protein
MSQFSFSTLSGIYAYIDPASGSILLQVIIAGTLGAFGYFFRPIWRFFCMLRGKNTVPPPETPEQGDAADKP